MTAVPISLAAAAFVPLINALDMGADVWSPVVTSMVITALILLALWDTIVHCVSMDILALYNCCNYMFDRCDVF